MHFELLFCPVFLLCRFGLVSDLAVVIVSGFGGVRRVRFLRSGCAFWIFVAGSLRFQLAFGNVSLSPR